MTSISHANYLNDFQQAVNNKIGSGTCASVFKITKKSTGQHYALKKIKLKILEPISPSLHELQITRMLSDKAIPKLYYYFDYFQSKDTHVLCFIMELCDGSLTSYISQRSQMKNKFTSNEILDYIIQMTRIFAKMQRMKILHRDIKPDNILIKYQDENKIKYYLCDFGYSVQKNEYSAFSITGTQDYVSPRIKKKFLNTSLVIKQITELDDIYSFGKTILEMICFKKFNNQQINENLINMICQNLNPFGYQIQSILRTILYHDQRNRIDFISLQNALMSEFPNKYNKNAFNQQNNIIDLISLQSSINQENYYQKQQLVQSIIQDICQYFAQKEHSLHISNIKSEQNQYQQQQQQRLEKATDFKLNQINDTKKFQTKNNEEQTKYETNNLCYYKKINIESRINCINKLENYILLGLRNYLGVIITNENKINKNQLFLFPLQQTNKNKNKDILNDQFFVKQIKITQNMVYVFGHQNYFWKKQRDIVKKLFLSLDQQECTEQIKSQYFTQKNKNKNISLFKNKPQKSLTKFNVFKSNLNIFDKIQVKNSIQSIYLKPFKEQIQKNKQNKQYKNQYYLGDSKGYIMYYQNQQLIWKKKLQSESITSLLVDQQFLIYQVSYGLIKKILLKNLENYQPSIYQQLICFSQQSELINLHTSNQFSNTQSTNTNKSNTLQAQIFLHNYNCPLISIQFIQNYTNIQNNTKNNTQNYPYIKLTTVNGDYIQLNNKMKLITKTKFNGVFLTAFKQIQGQNQNITQNVQKIKTQKKKKKKQNTQDIKRKKQMTYIINQMGELYNVDKLQKLNDYKINNATSLFINKNLIIMGNYDGQVIFSIQNVQKKQKIKKNKKQKQTKQKKIINQKQLIKKTFKQLNHKICLQLIKRIKKRVELLQKLKQNKKYQKSQKSIIIQTQKNTFLSNKIKKLNTPLKNNIQNQILSNKSTAYQYNSTTYKTPSNYIKKQKSFCNSNIINYHNFTAFNSINNNFNNFDKKTKIKC